MSIVFGCAVSHAPGISAWPDAAPPQQRDAIYGGFARLRESLAAATPDALVLFTSEHWTNYFLDHMSAFCIGRATEYSGPTEPWLKIERRRVAGEASLARQLIETCYENGVEPGYAHEMNFDHGTMLPLHFLRPEMDIPVVPIMINTLATPQPSPRRCFELGRIVGNFARTANRRIALIATGGLSHDPGELRHGWIDSDFDRRFMAEMRDSELDRLAHYSIAELAEKGAGAIELLAWIALAGAMNPYQAEIISYEAVAPWATGTGLMLLSAVS